MLSLAEFHGEIGQVLDGGDPEAQELSSLMEEGHCSIPPAMCYKPICSTKLLWNK